MKPRTTAELIEVLTKHYGSSKAVNDAARELWQKENGDRLMLKVDALWKLYDNLNRETSC